MTVYNVSVSEVGSASDTPSDAAKFATVVAESNSTPSAPQYLTAGQVFASRASTATYFNNAGTLQTAAANTLRTTYNPASLALLGNLVEPASTNTLSNNSMVGTVAGSPGTVPTSWVYQNVSGITQTIVGTGTESGIPYLDISITGNSSAGGVFAVFFQLANIPASTGQNWTYSFYLKYPSGAPTGFSAVTSLVQVVSPTNAYLGGYSSASVMANGSTTSLASYRSTTTSNLVLSNIAYIRSGISFTCPANTAVSGTFRIGAPQLELNPVATSLILTTNAPQTRAADYFIGTFDTATQKARFATSVAEIGSASDAILGSNLTSAASSDSGLASDSTTGVRMVSAATVETGSAADITNTAATVSGAVSEAANALDGVSASAILFSGSTDACAASDTPIGQTSIASLIAEAAAAMETASASVIFSAIATDVLYSNDNYAFSIIPKTEINIGDAIILQIKANASIFGGRVAGAASLDVFGDYQSVNLAVPACYVVPIASRAMTNSLAIGYRQDVSEKFGVIVALDNSTDTRGQTASGYIDAVEAQLLKSLANWKPDIKRDRIGFVYEGRDILAADMTRSRLYVQYSFYSDYQITNADVYQPTGVPFQTVNATTAFNNTSFGTVIPFDAPPDQGETPNITVSTSVSDAIILQLKEYCPTLLEVSGAATTDAFWKDQSVNLKVPAAYVVPLPSSTEEMKLGVGYKQMQTKAFAVVVALSNKSDARGETAISVLNTLKWEMIASLANWKLDPVNSPRGGMYRGYQVIGMDAARVWVQFTFSFEFQITDVDVYQPTGVPLTQINQRSFNGNTIVDAQVKLSQS